MKPAGFPAAGELVMFRKSTYFLLLLFLVACGGGQKPGPTPSAEEKELQAARVLAAALVELQPASMYVIMDTTATGPGGSEETDRIISLAKENMPGIDPQVLEDFRQQNTASQPVKSDMQLGSSFILLSQEVMKNIFSQNRDGWQLFYEQYPQALGITTISQVGFNPAMDQALVYVGTLSHYLAGAGYIVFLHQVDGNWKVEQKVMTWIS
jgi:hypothetical protein